MLCYFADHTVSTTCCRGISRDSDSKSMLSGQSGSGIVDHTASISVVDPPTRIAAM